MGKTGVYDMDNIIINKYKTIKRKKELIHLLFMTAGLIFLYFFLNFLIQKTSFLLTEGNFLIQNTFILVIVLLLALASLIILGLFTLTKVAAKIYPRYHNDIICHNIIEIKMLLTNLYQGEKEEIEDFIGLFRFKIESAYNNQYTAISIDKICMIYNDYKTMLNRL